MAGPSQASIKVVKSFSFRGAPRLWSNRYYLNASSIDTQAHFNTLADAVVLAEKAIYKPSTSIVEVLAYNPGSEVAVWTRTYSTAGTLTTGTGVLPPGEVAALVRFSTSQRTSKNHPLFLFNYYHGCLVPNTGGDGLDSTYNSALTTYANAWVTGFSDGVTTYKKAGPQGAVALGATVESWLTHRDFPR